MLKYIFFWGIRKTDTENITCQIPTVSSDSEAIEVNMLDYLILGRYESMGTAFPPGITDLPDFEAALLMLSWFILKLQ